MKQEKYIVTFFCSSFSHILGFPSVTQNSFVQSQNNKESRCQTSCTWFSHSVPESSMSCIVVFCLDKAPVRYILPASTSKHSLLEQNLF